MKISTTGVAGTTITPIPSSATTSSTPQPSAYSQPASHATPEPVGFPHPYPSSQYSPYTNSQQPPPPRNHRSYASYLPPAGAGAGVHMIPGSYDEYPPPTIPIDQSTYGYPSQHPSHPPFPHPHLASQHQVIAEGRSPSPGALMAARGAGAHRDQIIPPKMLPGDNVISIKFSIEQQQSSSSIGGQDPPELADTTLAARGIGLESTGASGSGRRESISAFLEAPDDAAFNGNENVNKDDNDSNSTSSLSLPVDVEGTEANGGGILTTADLAGPSSSGASVLGSCSFESSASSLASAESLAEVSSAGHSTSVEKPSGGTNSTNTSSNSARNNNSNSVPSNIINNSSSYTTTGSNSSLASASNPSVNATTLVYSRPSDIPPHLKLTQALMGTLVVPCTVLLDHEGKEGMFFVFHDLSVRTQGSYRLKFHLVDADR
ncbi:hypothetical protein HDV05_005947 [Chytridiales sp. JEL 0842]|nr:hypothetical protein HDV05_005947 [Chytridiales sp. JEL 0842]